jgi:hypothetical protein
MNLDRLAGLNDSLTSGGVHEPYDVVALQDVDSGIPSGDLFVGGPTVASINELMDLAGINVDGKEVFASEYLGLMHTILGNVGQINGSMGRSVPLSTAHIETMVTLAGFMQDDEEVHDGQLFDDGFIGDMTYDAYGNYWREKIDSTKALGGSLFNVDQLRYLLYLANQKSLDQVLPASNYVDLVWSYIQIFKGGNHNFSLPPEQVKKIAFIAGIVKETSATLQVETG